VHNLTDKVNIFEFLKGGMSLAEVEGLYMGKMNEASWFSR
jgi:hypothetical protein